MARQTPRLGLEIWDPNDNVRREHFNKNWQRLEAAVALRSDTDQPFYVKGVTYEVNNNRLAVVLGPGRANFLGTLVSKATDTTYYINAPTTNRTYHLFIGATGAFTHRTTPDEIPGHVRLWEIRTGAALTDPVTVTDVRGQLAGASARMVQDALTAHIADSNPHPQYATTTALSNHANNKDNPHNTTAFQVGAIVGVGGVTNPGGQVNLAGGGAIQIQADNGANKRITITETHSSRTDNPHQTTAAQVGALVSVEGVSAPGGNIDLVGNGVTISGDNTNKRITFTVTAASVGAVVSVDGVTNAGGNIDLVAGGAITITPDNTLKRITISETHSSRTDNPHNVTWQQVGAAPASHTHPGNQITSAVPDSEKLGGVAASNYSRKDVDETRNANITMGSGKYITLSGNPTQNLHAAPKQYVDEHGMTRWLQEAGWGVATGLVVSPQSGLTLAISAGRAYLSNGTKRGYNATTVTLDPADTTYARKDVVTIDANGNFVVVKGTPASSPAEPAIPGTSIKLAVVTVPKSASSISASNIVDDRRFIIGMANGRIVLPVGTNMWAT